MAEWKYYAAYGSNMNLGQMRHRCPTAELLGCSKLHGWRLLFRGGWENAVATIEPEENCSVPVLVWRLQPGDEKALDSYEGWPHLYRKETVQLSLGMEQISAMVYVMNDGHPYGTPGTFYYDTIRQGYCSAGINADILDAAVAASYRLRLTENDTTPFSQEKTRLDENAKLSD